jgi:hypothetical protein
MNFHPNFLKFTQILELVINILERFTNFDPLKDSKFLIDCKSNKKNIGKSTKD